MISMRRYTVVMFCVLCGIAVPTFGAVQSEKESISEEQALALGEEFGIVVGEVDREIQEFLGLTRAEGVVVFEVIGGTPADLAGIKSRAIIKEVDSIEIKTLLDLGRALKPHCLLKTLR